MCYSPTILMNWASLKKLYTQKERIYQDLLCNEEFQIKEVAKVLSVKFLLILKLKQTKVMALVC